ncbi:MAG: HAD family hydrolase [Gammaproteobacteria bacterium]
MIDVGIEAVIFDLDGLVLDTEATYFSAWSEAAASMGYRLPEELYGALSGLHYQAVEQRLVDFFSPSFDLATFGRISAECWRRHVQREGIAVKKGFDVLLDLLKEYRIPFALATNSRSSNALECLALAGLCEVFPVMVARDHVEYGKPAPDLFLIAAARLGIPVRNCLVLEDSAIGVRAAVVAGAFTVFVPSCLPADSQATALCHRQCRDLTEVAALLRANLTNR